MSIAAGASSEISVAKMLFTDRLKLISPMPERDGEHQLQHPHHALVAPVEVAREPEARAPQPRQRQQQLHERAEQDADRVRVDAVVALERGVSATSVAMITRFQNSGAIAGTAKCSKLFSTPTTSPESPSISTIGNISCARLTVRSVSSSSKPGREQRHDHRRQQHEQRRDQAQRHRDHEHERGGDPERLLAAAVLELLGEDRARTPPAAPRRRTGCGSGSGPGTRS